MSSKAAPDGYTLLVGASGMAINQSLYAKLPYDSVRDFVAISELASFPLLLVVNSSSPIKSVAEFVAYAKANADKMNYATSSATFQLVTELFKQKTGAPMQAIPYKSANEMVLAVVSGQVAATIADAGPVSPQVKAGTVRALAVTAEKRMADFPDVPTMKEAGADVNAIIWTGVFAPKGTPPEIVKKLEGRVHEDRQAARRCLAAESHRGRRRRHLDRGVHENTSERHRTMGRSRQISQYQDRAVRALFTATSSGDRVGTTVGDRATVCWRTRHARPCAGHPRLYSRRATKTWMAGT